MKRQDATNGVQEPLQLYENKKEDEEEEEEEELREKKSGWG
jgi:hypothetical protein